MPKYIVTLERPCVERAVVEVEAETEQEASEEGLAQADVRDAWTYHNETGSYRAEVREIK